VTLITGERGDFCVYGNVTSGFTKRPRIYLLALRLPASQKGLSYMQFAAC